MALIYLEGWESLPLLRPGYAPTVTPVAVTGRDGVGKALSAASLGQISYSLPAPAATVITGFAFMVNTVLAFNSTATNYRLLTVESDAAATEHLSLTFSATGQLQLRRGAANGTVIATATTACALNTWYFLEVKATIADAGGICVVKLDEQTVINFSGDTKNGGTLTTVSGFELHCGTAYTIDDHYVLDGTGSAPMNDFIGDQNIKAFRPSATGAQSDFVGSDADSTNNYALVDEATNDTSDYVTSGTVGARDFYELTDLTAPSPMVRAVQPMFIARKSDPGGRSIKPLLRSSGGTVLQQTAKPVQSSWAVIPGDIATTDATGAPWVPTEFNATQLGLEVV